jgi:hypothetical protein
MKIAIEKLALVINIKSVSKSPIACFAYFKKKIEIAPPQPFILDFFTPFTKKPVIYADCYMGFSLSNSSFIVSPKLYKVLYDMNI